MMYQILCGVHAQVSYINLLSIYSYTYISSSTISLSLSLYIYIYLSSSILYIHRSCRRNCGLISMASPSEGYPVRGILSLCVLGARPGQV